MKGFFRFGALLALAVWAAVWVVAKTSVRSSQDSLQKIRTEIDQKKREKKSASRRANELREEVDRISNELASARRSLSKVNARLAKAEKNRSEAEARLVASGRDLREWREGLSAGIRGHYMRWVLAREGSVPVVIYEQALLRDRAASLAFAQENHQSVEGFRDDWLAAEDDLRQIRLEKVREERRAEVARKRMEELRKTAEGRKVVLDRQIKELNVSARRFEKLIAGLILKEKQERARAEEKDRLAAARTGSTGEGAAEKKTIHSAAKSSEGLKWRGRLPWPVAGAVIEKFGRRFNPEIGAPTISNGVTLRPGLEAPVRAVQGGEVLFAGPFMNYGLMALVSHPDHLHTIYAHLGDLKVSRGQAVLAGDTVGDPGRDDQGRPLVYFEIRLDGEPVNPEGWLRSL